MVFASNIFLFLFLPLFFMVYFATPFRFKSAVILLGSYLFYAWWRVDYLLLFVAVSAWNYYLGNEIYRYRSSNKARAYKILTLAVVGNLATLGYYKYTNFGVEVITTFLEGFGWNTFTLEHIILPLGISFYIFQAISYIVDLFKGSAKPAKRFIDFAAYIALFPQLIAGPIVRYKYVSDQLHHREHNMDLFSLGVSRFMLGFTMKVLIADSLGVFSVYLLTSPDTGSIDTTIAFVGGMLQLFFDFSGYSHMAIGLGLMMGFRFPENFNHPFSCCSVTEFWQRWHMTLADFLRTYVFMPLVRSKKVGGDFALWLTLLISGIWHGANVAFIIWGAYVGAVMVAERKLGLVTKPNAPYRPLRGIYALVMVFTGYPCFLAGSWENLTKIYTGFFGFNGFGDINFLITQVGYISIVFFVVAIVWIFVGGAVHRRYLVAPEKGYLMQHIRSYSAVWLWLLFALAITRLEANKFSPFLYFQF